MATKFKMAVFKIERRNYQNVHAIYKFSILHGSKVMAKNNTSNTFGMSSDSFTWLSACHTYVTLVAPLTRHITLTETHPCLLVTTGIGDGSLYIAVTS